MMRVLTSLVNCFKETLWGSGEEKEDERELAKKKREDEWVSSLYVSKRLCQLGTRGILATDYCMYLRQELKFKWTQIRHRLLFRIMGRTDQNNTDDYNL